MGTLVNYSEQDAKIFEDITTSINPSNFESREEYKWEIVRFCSKKYRTVPSSINDFIDEKWENS